MFNFGFSNNKRTLSKGGLLFLVKPPSMVDTIGLSVSQLPALEPIGTTYYLNTANTYNGNGLSDAPAVGAGQAGAFNSFVSAIAAINVAGGTIKILPGIHVGAAAYQITKPALIESYSGLASETIVDFAASSGQFNVLDATGANIFSKLTIKNSTAATGAVYVNSALATDNRVQDCILKDNVCHAQALNSHIKILRNKLLGVRSGDKALYFYTYNGNDYGHLVDFNVFAPSENYLSATSTVRSNQAAAATSKFNNNVFIGSANGSNIYVQKSGALAPGIVCKNNSGNGGYYSALTGVMWVTGDLSRSTFDKNITIAPQKTYALFPNGTGGATVTSHISGEFGIKRYPRKALLGLNIDDTNAYNGVGELNIPAIIPVLAEHGIKMTWHVTSRTIDAEVLAVVKTWLDAGHEIGLHGFTHSSLTTATSLQGVTKAGAALTITIDDSAANPRDWTGTVAIDGGASVTIDGNHLDATNISTYGELKTWLIAQGVTVGTDLAEFKIESLCVSLANQTSLSINAATNLPMNSTRFKKVEIVYGKYDIERQIRTITGYGSWECKSWGSPYENNDAVGMDVMKTAGLTISRAAINGDIPDINQVSCNVVTPLNIYAVTAMAWGSVANAWGHLKDSVTSLVTPDKVYGHLAWMVTLGSVSASYMHYNSGTEEEFRILLAGIVDMQNRGNLISGTLTEISDYIRANGTEIAGDGSGRQEQWYLPYAADYGDYELLAESPCIDAGVNPFIAADGDQYDADGYKIYDSTLAIPDGHWIDGVDIGAYAYGGANKVYTGVYEKSEGVFAWRSIPELITQIGVDNAVYNADSTGKEFASKTLALAALASLADDEYLFGGTKGAALYSADKSAKADKIEQVLDDVVTPGIPALNLKFLALTENGMVDSIGLSSGPVQPGRAYTGACTVAITGLLTTDTITADSADKPTCSVDGTLTIAAGAVVYGVTITRSAVVIGYYPCAEGAGVTCLNTISGGSALPHGTISAATVHTLLYDGTGFDLNIAGFTTICDLSVGVMP